MNQRINSRVASRIGNSATLGLLAGASEMLGSPWKPGAALAMERVTKNLGAFGAAHNKPTALDPTAKG